MYSVFGVRRGANVIMKMPRVIQTNYNNIKTTSEKQTLFYDKAHDRRLKFKRSSVFFQVLNIKSLWTRNNVVITVSYIVCTNLVKWLHMFCYFEQCLLSWISRSLTFLMEIRDYTNNQFKCLKEKIVVNWEFVQLS